MKHVMQCNICFGNHQTDSYPTNQEVSFVHNQYEQNQNGMNYERGNNKNF